MKYVWVLLCCSLLAFSSCPTGGGVEGDGIKDGGKGDSSDPGDKYPPLPPGPTSPEAVVERLEKYLSQKDFENFFQYRFGTDKWAERGPSSSSLANRHDYYSYENLKRAVWELAYLKYKVQYRINEWDGSIAGWNYRAEVTNKATGEPFLVYEEPEFNALWNLDKDIFTVEVDYGNFLNEGSENDRKREIAACLANWVQETSDGNPEIPGEREAMGLFYNEEMGHEGSTGHNYWDTGIAFWPPQPGHSYHGRGPKQVSYNYNYGLFSAIIFQDKMVLLNNPEYLVKENPKGGIPGVGNIGGVLGFKSAIWFWMTPQEQKPSCHDVMLSTWKPNAYQEKAGWKFGLGATIMVINGGVEGGRGESDSQVGTRVRSYRMFAKAMGADITGEKLDTLGMSQL